jgi:hypothetical protein
MSPEHLWSKFYENTKAPTKITIISNITPIARHRRNVQIYHGMFKEREFWPTNELIAEFTRRVQLSDEAF